ncbi:expressed unknown protein [Seminavis robusta]|uniref:Uncharacterized protein n=1 Tax=Seminavis robusta TaxID=568900 RepID=A0A9N8HKS0_9STRA|nr:expressed unknown protein [Seminavis robusta]|eukprot:Sro967_g225880.1 n/a (175) ;mRNA; f:31857-32381
MTIIGKRLYRQLIAVCTTRLEPRILKPKLHCWTHHASSRCRSVPSILRSLHVIPTNNNQGSTSVFGTVMGLSVVAIASFKALTYTTHCHEEQAAEAERQESSSEKEDTATYSGSSHSTTTTLQDEEMVNAYVRSLMKDDTLVKLPLNLGTAAPHLMDLTELHRVLVWEAIHSCL